MDADLVTRFQALGSAMSSSVPSMRELATTLRRELAGEVRDDAYTRHLFATDASAFAIEPAAVAFPRNADDVAAAVTVCARLGVPIVPRGGGTSLAGQAAGGRGLVL